MSKQRKSRPAGSPDGRRRDAGTLVNHHSSTAGPNFTTILVWHAGRVVGEVREENGARVFQKRVRGSVHFLRSPRAVAWDLTALHEAERLGATGVLVIDTETGREYRAPLSTVWAKGWAFDRGHGRQWALRLDIFNRPEEPAQLPLFGGMA